MCAVKLAYNCSFLRAHLSWECTALVEPHSFRLFLEYWRSPGVSLCPSDGSLKDRASCQSGLFSFAVCDSSFFCVIDNLGHCLD